MGVSTPVNHPGYGQSVEPVCTHQYLQLPTIDLCDVTSADHVLPGSNFLHSSALPFAATSTTHEVWRAILISVVM
jgi:hypothetical protein